MRHTAKISLLGGYPATIEWHDDREEGEITLIDPIFFTYIHEHTRADARSKATRVAPDITRWHFVSY